MRDETSVYLIGMKDSYGQMLPYTKVGIAGDINARLDALSTGSPFEYFAHCKSTFDCRKHARQIEREFHTTLRKKRVRGEWFRGTPSDIEEILRESEGEDGVQFQYVPRKSPLQ